MFCYLELLLMQFSYHQILLLTKGHPKKENATEFLPTELIHNDSSLVFVWLQFRFKDVLVINLSAHAFYKKKLLR